eukprot:jgi/Bigna1/79687/fgenesh1_pg.64_\
MPALWQMAFKLRLNPPSPVESAQLDVVIAFFVFVLRCGIIEPFSPPPSFSYHHEGRKLELFREWQGMKESDTEEVLKALTAKDEYPQDSEEVVAPLKTMAQKLEDGDSHFVREEEDPVHYSLEELRADGHIPLDVMGQEVLVGDYIRYYRDKLPPHKRDSSCYYKVWLVLYVCSNGVTPSSFRKTIETTASFISNFSSLASSFCLQLSIRVCVFVLFGIIQVVDLIPIEQKAQGGAGKNGRKLAAEHEDQRRSFMRGETYFTWELVTDKGRIPFDRMAWLRVDPDEVLNAPKADEGVPVGSTSTDQEELT